MKGRETSQRYSRKSIEIIWEFLMENRSGDDVKKLMLGMPPLRFVSIIDSFCSIPVSYKIGTAAINSESCAERDSPFPPST